MAEVKKSRLGEIFITFFKLGCIGFGGGFSMIPLIEREVVEKKKWVEKEEIVDILAVASSLPGATALNASAFVGYSVAGIPGAVLALLGNMAPSVIIVLTLSAMFVKFSTYAVVKAAFKGIYPVITGLIFYAAYKIGKTSIKDKTGMIIGVVTLGCSMFLGIDPIPLIICGGISGVLITSIRCRHMHKSVEKQAGRDV